MANSSKQDLLAYPDDESSKKNVFMSQLSPRDAATLCDYVSLLTGPYSGSMRAPAKLAPRVQRIRRVKALCDDKPPPISFMILHDMHKIIKRIENNDYDEIMFSNLTSILKTVIEPFSKESQHYSLTLLLIDLLEENLCSLTNTYEYTQQTPAKAFIVLPLLKQLHATLTDFYHYKCAVNDCCVHAHPTSFETNLALVHSREFS